MTQTPTQGASSDRLQLVSSLGTSQSFCRVLREDADLAASVPAELRETAIAECVAPLADLPRGTWSGQNDLRGDGIGLLVLDGLLVRRVGIEGRFGAELVGEGDLLRPWQEDLSVTTSTNWRVLQPSRLAVLDTQVTRGLAAYPSLVVALVDRALNRARSLAAMMAIVHHARVEARLELLLWLLADRWGKVTTDGVRLPLKLTHSVLGELIAARRPTVTVGLSALAKRGVMTPLPGGGWRLHGKPPGELQLLSPTRMLI
jgi:CRP/FNR family transcriptional regulator, cyclic AMP receptor protein